MEDNKKMKNKHKQSLKILAVAASVCIILAASSTVYATNMFGLKDMLIGNTNSPSTNSTVKQNNNSDPIPADENDNAETVEDNVYPVDTITAVPTPPVEFISLQGFADSNESKAVAEWTNFCDGYDQDVSLLAEVGNGPTGLDAKYNLYLVYTQEMADKLDEIIDKFNLSLHSTINFLSTDELIQQAGTGNFLGTANTAYSTYMYEDGTFHFDGAAHLANGVAIDYQFMNCKKGSFTDVILNVGSINDYEEWTYTTTSGTTVLLAISPSKSLIITDLGNSFITVNVLAGTEHGFLDDSGKITSTDLEAFANTFDFSLIK
jgi:hypothetical protein